MVFSLITVFLTVAVAWFWRVWCSGKRCVAKRYIGPADSALRGAIIHFNLDFQRLFNQSFGEINMMLSALFGVNPPGSAIRPLPERC